MRSHPRKCLFSIYKQTRGGRGQKKRERKKCPRFAASDAVSWKRQSFAATAMPTNAHVFTIHLQFLHPRQPFNRSPCTSLSCLLLPLLRRTTSHSRFDASNKCDQNHPGLCVSVLERIKCEIRDTTSRRILPISNVFVYISSVPIIFVSPDWWPLVERFYLHFVSLKQNKNISHVMRAANGALHTQQPNSPTSSFHNTHAFTKQVRHMCLCRALVVRTHFVCIPCALRAHRCETFLFLANYKNKYFAGAQTSVQ